MVDPPRSGAGSPSTGRRVRFRPRFQLLSGDGAWQPDARGCPVGARPLLDITSAGGRTELAFVDFLEAVTTGRPAYQIRYGLEFWSDLDANPKLRSTFDRQMNWRFGDGARQIAMNYDWGRFRNIVDVGGGDGMLLAHILETHPGVHGSVVELPPTAKAAGGRFGAAGLTDRATATAGSFFDPLPRGADAYILCRHPPRLGRRELPRDPRPMCGRGRSVRVVVIEAFRGFAYTTRWDLSMLISFNGKERNSKGTDRRKHQLTARLAPTIAVVHKPRTSIYECSTENDRHPRP